MTYTNPITKALLAAMMHSTEPMVLTDPHLADHPMIAVNPAFEALTGYGVAETVGRNCRFLQGVDTDPATPRRIRSCLAERRGCVEWIVNHRRDGTAFWNLLFISPVFDASGALLHYFGNQRDITNGMSNPVPDHVFGKADMPLEGQADFQNALMVVLLNTPSAGQTEAQRARGLERVVEAARRLNEATTRLTPAPWSMPAR